MDLIPAATIVTLRQSSTGPEVLLVHRNPELPVQGGAWSFPGGHVGDCDGSFEGDQRLDTAKACAVREMREETGVGVDPSGLTLLTRWVTPPEMTTRFHSWIFVTADGGDAVKVDGREIIGHRWCPAGQALDLHHGGRIRLAPPAFVILCNLLGHATVDGILDQADRLIPGLFEPRLATLPDGGCALYREDAGYADKDIDRGGPRHRLWMRAGGWRYERSFTQ
ncbi:MAG: NUDIX hydrolase [Desulfosarcinaceae bacterium]